MHNQHRFWHFACCVLPILSIVLWVASIVFVIAAWVSVAMDQIVWGYGAQWWIVNALMFGVLALFGHNKGSYNWSSSCKDCGSPDGKCVCAK